MSSQVAQYISEGEGEPFQAKCELLKKKVRYSGHVMSEDGVEAVPDKTALIEAWKAPQDAKELCEFLGFTGYYSKKAKPLTEG